MNEAAPTLPFPTHDMMSQGRSAPPLDAQGLGHGFDGFSLSPPRHPAIAGVLSQILDTQHKILNEMSLLRKHITEANGVEEVGPAKAPKGPPAPKSPKVNRTMMEVSLSKLFEIYGRDRMFGARDIVNLLEKEEDVSILITDMQRALGGELKVTAKGMLVFLRRGVGLTTTEGGHVLRSQSVCKTRVFWFEQISAADPLS